MTKKIAIIGSTSYKDQIYNYKHQLTLKGYEVRLPVFDDKKLSEMEIASRNLENIKWADEVHLFWNQRTLGTIFDFGMCFALKKPLKIIYIHKQAIANFMKQYSKQFSFQP